MKTQYCILPSGNATEFPRLDSELKRRGVKASFAPLPNGGRLYRIPGAEQRKLPRDAGGRYLGDDNSGRSIYPLTGAAIAALFSPGKPKWESIR